MNKRNDLGNELLEIRTFIEHGMFMPEIIKKLSLMGFGPKEMIKGRNLLEATHDEHEKHNSFRKESLQTSDQFTIKFNEIYEEFARHRGRAKVAFRNNEYILNDFLAVNKGQSIKYVDWLTAAKRFYHNSLASREIIHSFRKVLVFRVELEKSLNDIEELERLRLKQEYESGQSKIHTEIRNEKLSKLKEWYNEALSIARVALENEPNLLEALGVKVEDE